MKGFSVSSVTIFFLVARLFRRKFFRFVDCRVIKFLIIVEEGVRYHVNVDCFLFLCWVIG